MKKLKGIKLTKFFVSLLSLIFFFSFWSCKSAPELSEVDPLDLIDNQSHFYLRIPKSVDPKLVGRMLKNTKFMAWLDRKAGNLEKAGLGGNE